MKDHRTNTTRRRRVIGAARACLIVLFAGLSADVPAASVGNGNGFSLPKLAASDGSLERVQKRGELIIGTSNDWPYSYLDAKTGAFSGIDADIIQAAAKLLNIKKVTVQTVPFDGLVPGVLSGRFDMVGDSIHFTPERAKLVSFSFPTYYYAETLVVKKGSKINA